MVEIRRITEPEAETVTALWDQMCREPAGGGPLHPRGRRNIDAQMRGSASHPEEFCLVAVEDERVVGFVKGLTTRQPLLPGVAGEIEALYVVPSARGKGTSAELATAAVEHLRRRGRHHPHRRVHRRPRSARLLGEGLFQRGHAALLALRFRRVMVVAVNKRLLLLAFTLLLSLFFAGPAGGAFPGKNGRVAYEASGAQDYGDPADSVQAIADVTAGGRGQRRLAGCTIKDERPARGNCDLGYSAPAYSPNGKRIVFDAGSRLAIMNSNGSGLRVLARQTRDDSEPAFSPSGRRLVFTGRTRVRGRRRLNLYILNLRSGRTRRLTRRGGRQAAWSSRNRIAFVRRDDIYIRRDGSSRRLSRGAQPDWSPHGSKLVFVRDGDVYTAPLSGLRPRRLPIGAGQGRRPVWSPDGTRIAYELVVPAPGFSGPPSGAPTHFTTIYAIRAKGRGRRRFVADGARGVYDVRAYDPSWQPLR